MQTAERIDLNDEAVAAEAANEKALKEEFKGSKPVEAEKVDEPKIDEVKINEPERKKPPVKQNKPSPWRRRLILAGVMLLIICVLFSIMLAAAMALTYQVFPVKGSNNVTSKTYTVKDFNRIVLDGKAEIIVTQAEDYSVKIEAEDNILDEIKAADVGNTLKIDKRKSLPFLWGRKLNNKKPIKIYIAANKLERINLNGEGKLSIDKFNAEKLTISASGENSAIVKNLTLKELDLKISGSFNGEFSGSTNKQKIRISGAGKYNAKDFKSSEAEIDISGAGDTFVHASEKLDVNISGAGTVTYSGSPKKVDQEISGSGKVTQAE